MFQEILKIINSWDPIGIKNITPEDEYSFEVQEIAEFLEKNKNADAVSLSKKIDEVFTKWFGSDTYQNNDSKQVAQKILDTIKRKLQ